MKEMDLISLILAQEHVHAIKHTYTHTKQLSLFYPG